MNINQEDLKLAIDNESVNIYIDTGEENEPIHIVYWHLDEIEEDANVVISMVNAVDMFHTNPQKLLDKIHPGEYHIESWVENFYKNSFGG